MAVIKHLSSKNANYAAAPLYLCFQHNEQTQRPLLDEDGHYIPREAYLISGIRCTPDSFPLECLKADLHYNQNRKKGDIKTHHYILSFDPRDRADHGLTLEEVQQMGEQFCEAHFPGHIALVCSHADGHQHAGNLHCHMVIHSLRVEDVERKSYCPRPRKMTPNRRPKLSSRRRIPSQQPGHAVAALTLPQPMCYTTQGFNSNQSP